MREKFVSNLLAFTQPYNERKVQIIPGLSENEVGQKVQQGIKALQYNGIRAAD